MTTGPILAQRFTAGQHQRPEALAYGRVGHQLAVVALARPAFQALVDEHGRAPRLVGEVIQAQGSGGCLAGQILQHPGYVVQPYTQRPGPDHERFHISAQQPLQRLQLVRGRRPGDGIATHSLKWGDAGPQLALQQRHDFRAGQVGRLQAGIGVAYGGARIVATGFRQPVVAQRRLHGAQTVGAMVNAAAVVATLQRRAMQVRIRIEGARQPPGGFRRLRLAPAGQRRRVYIDLPAPAATVRTLRPDAHELVQHAESYAAR